MNFKNMMSRISTIVALVVKLDSLLYKKLEKMSCKADSVTSAPSCFKTLCTFSMKAWFSHLKCTRSLEESNSLVWGSSQSNDF